MPSVIITGGTKGIGRSLVAKFASEGFDIATCARNEDELNNLKKITEKENPGIKVLAIKCDASVKTDIQNFGKTVINTLGIPDVLINNVGIFLPGTILDENEGDFEKLINTNLASAYHLTRVIAPEMIKRKSGYIFNLCSTASIVAYTNGGSYCISKFGMLGFSKVLREEMKEFNIRVSSVLPGATNTDSWKGSNIPPERFMAPEDIANLIFYFYKTPVNINVEEILIRPIQGDIS
mgnify:CR=1 FL=1